MPFRELTRLPSKEDIDKLVQSLPRQVEIVGTTFGNELQNKINNKLIIANLFLFYIGVILTLEFLF